MSIKVELLKWAVKTFGELDPHDTIDIREDVINTDKPEIIQQKIVLFVKKRIGKDENWLERAKIEDWEKTLKEMVGEHQAFNIKDNEGRERHKVSGMVGEDYKEIRLVHIYNYQFNLEIIKYRKTKEKSHVGIKPRT